MMGRRRRPVVGPVPARWLVVDDLEVVLVVVFWADGREREELTVLLPKIGPLVPGALPGGSEIETELAEAMSANYW